MARKMKSALTARVMWAIECFTHWADTTVDDPVKRKCVRNTVRGSRGTGVDGIVDRLLLGRASSSVM